MAFTIAYKVRIENVNDVHYVVRGFNFWILQSASIEG